MTTAITKSQKEVLFKSDYTGINTSGGMVYPPVINILQSDKQFSAFGDAEMSTKHYGKLFIRTEVNTPEDLVEEIEGTAIKIEVGHEIRDDSGVIDSGERLLSSEEKEEVEAKGLKPINMVKVLLALGDSKEVIAQAKKYEEKLASNSATSSDFPFALLSIKGTSWGSWIEAQQKMDELCQRQYGVSANDTMASLFKFTVKSKEEHSAKYGKYYSVDVDVELNDPDEAAEFAPLVMGMKDFGLFYKVAEKTNPDKSVDAEKVFEGM